MIEVECGWLGQRSPHTVLCRNLEDVLGGSVFLSVLCYSTRHGTLSAHLPIVVEHINCWFLLDFCGTYWQFGLHPKFARG